MLFVPCNSDLIVQAKILVDRFPVFARKLVAAAQDCTTAGARLEQRTNQSTRYYGNAAHHTLLLGAFKSVDVVSDEAHAVLMRFERKFGNDVVASNWNNLTRILQTCFQYVNTSVWVRAVLRLILCSRLRCALRGHWRTRGCRPPLIPWSGSTRPRTGVWARGAVRAPLPCHGG